MEGSFHEIGERETGALTTAAAAPAPGERRRVLPDGLRLGAVHLRVGDLGRATEFYEGVIGLRVVDRAPGPVGATVSLAAGGATDGATDAAHALIVLHESAGARPAGRGAGLYHVAVLYPSQIELARVARRVFERHVAIQGASDHGTHEAIYLADPDGNGLELAADRPRDQWPDVSKIDAIAPRPLDIGNLFNLTSGQPAEPHADAGTTIGHVHLHVGDVARALSFYRDLIGFDLVTRIDSAAFVSAGGYHHHLAFNVWRGENGQSPAAGTDGLLYWTIELPTVEDVDAARERLNASGHDTNPFDGGFGVADPWGIELRVIATA